MLVVGRVYDGEALRKTLKCATVFESKSFLMPMYAPLLRNSLRKCDGNLPEEYEKRSQSLAQINTATTEPAAT